MNEPAENEERPAPPTHVSARVPERVAPGVFSTGAIIMTGRYEFIFDFVQNLSRPHRVAARVILPHPVLPQFVEALRKNVELYEKNLGPLPVLPKPPGKQPAEKRTAQEIYDDLKLPPDTLSGTYANGVMIAHTAGEFGMDFLTNFFPHSAVSARVFVSASQIPRLLESMQATQQQFEQRIRQQRQGGPPPGGPQDMPRPREAPPQEPEGGEEGE